MKIPADLVRQVQDGNVVLFLGAGASFGARDSNDNPPPSAEQLASLLAEKFLGGSHREDPLHIVAELAISERDLPTVQEYIRTVFEDIRPAPFHQLMATFRWTGIATTNFDRVVERAYEACAERVQTVIPMIKNGDRVEERLKSPDSLMLLKLHGCITRTSDKSVPLILTVDQYITHRQGRDRVFDHLKNWAYEHTIVFVGYSLQDPDIRRMLLELGSDEERPRFYTVTPSPSDEERRLWERKRISPLQGTFDEFLQTLDGEIQTPFRGVGHVPSQPDLPIAERFVVPEPGLSEGCRNFLTDDVEYVRLPMPAKAIEPQDFYRGFPGGWAAIDQGLDVRRTLTDTILSDVILNDGRDTTSCGMYLVRGEAGSGKSVLLRRIAWDAAIDFKKLCLFVRPHGRLSFDALQELAEVTRERIFLFVDNASEHTNGILDLMTKAERTQLPLAVITAERHNEWNMSCEVLVPYVTEEVELPYLSTREIEELVSLLERHRSLGYLESASHDERIKALEVTAGRQLLVALHEATLGKPFEDIIADEFAELKPDLAQSMYLGICVLNRFGAPVRAGIIARVYGVRFTQFREKFFRPLERVVLTSYDERTRDYVYAARHPHIAEIVFERVLSSASERLDLYKRLLRSLNIDYDADRAAYRKLIRAREIVELFPDHTMALDVYDTCRDAIGEEPHLLHQRAIYEMRRHDGNLQRADELLRRAQALAQHDKTIRHSMAELSLLRAEKSTSQLEFQTYSREARKLALLETGREATTAHGYHTLAKVSLSRLEKLLHGPQEEVSEYEVGRLMKEAADAIEEGLQRFPDHPYLFDAEAKLSQLLSDEERALTALRRAFQADPRNSYATTRLGKYLSLSGELDEGRQVYEQALNLGATDKRVHYGYAKLLLDLDGDGGTIEHHLRRAFTKGDRNFEAQYWYARQLYVNGKIDEALEMFRVLGNCRLDPDVKRRVRGVIKEAGREKTFTGRVTKVESSYALIERDGPSDYVFLHISNVEGLLWSQLSLGMRLRFSIGFTFRGTAAINVEAE